MDISSHIRDLKSKLKNSTTLSRVKLLNSLPITIINFFRSLVDPSDEDPALQKIKNPYLYAKERFNRLWRIPEEKNQSPVEQLTTARGILASYWTAEKWRAYAQSTGLHSLAIFNGVLPAGIAILAADMMTTLGNTGFSADFSIAFAKMLGILGISSVSKYTATKFADNLSADITKHLQEKFEQTARSRPDIFKHIADAENEYHTEADDPKDQSASLGHSMFSAPRDFAEAAILRRSGLLSLVVSVAALGTVLYQNSVPIEVFDQLGEQFNRLVPNGNMDFTPGDKGTFIAALAATFIYSGVTIKMGRTLGKKEEEAMEKEEIHNSNVRDKLTKSFLTSNSGADLGSKPYQRDLIESRDYASHRIQAKLKHAKFQQIAGWLNWPFSFVPSALSLFSANTGFSALTGEAASSFWTNQAATLLFLDKVSEAVRVISSRGAMTVPRNHIVNLAKKIDAAWQTPAP